MRFRWWTWPVADLAAAGLLAAVMVAAIVASRDQPARSVDAVVVLAVVAIGVWVVIARCAPRTALVGACVSFFAALAIGVAAFSPALALGFPLFAVAVAGHLWWGIGVVGLIGSSSMFYRLLGEGAEPVAEVAVGTLFDVALLTVILLLGETLRSRRALREEAVLRLRLAEREHQQRITAERLRTARDLHDVLAHTVTVVGIQASVAAENIDEQPERAREAIESVRLASREAMADLRSTIAVLRAPRPRDSDPRPTPGLDQLPDLVDAARAAGVAATLQVRGDTTGLRPTVGLAVYRVVQESLTNALRHSAADSLEVVVDAGRDQVRVTVRDDGRGISGTPQPDKTAGSGLRGMSERVAALGGQVRYGPVGDGRPGWAVQARLPSGGASWR